MKMPSSASLGRWAGVLFAGLALAALEFLMFLGSVNAQDQLQWYGMIPDSETMATLQYSWFLQSGYEIASFFLFVPGMYLNPFLWGFGIAIAWNRSRLRSTIGARILQGVIVVTVVASAMYCYIAWAVMVRLYTPANDTGALGKLLLLIRECLAGPFLFVAKKHGGFLFLLLYCVLWGCAVYLCGSAVAYLWRKAGKGRRCAPPLE